MSGDLVKSGGALAQVPEELAAIERLVVNGDIGPLNAQDRVTYYRHRCDAAGLDWRTSPFEYLKFQGKLTLYARRTATDQLAALHNLSSEIVKRERMEGDLYRVQARITGKDGRATEDDGILFIGGKKGEDLANALMKTVTKAIRRATLRHCGLGMMADSEPETLQGAVRVELNESGEEVAEYPLDGSPVSDADAQLRAAKNALKRALDHRGCVGDEFRLFVCRKVAPKGEAMKHVYDGTIASMQKLARAILQTDEHVFGQFSAEFHGLSAEDPIPSYMQSPETIDASFVQEPVTGDPDAIAEVYDAEPTPEERHADALKACMAQFNNYDLSRMNPAQQKKWRLQTATIELDKAVTSYKDLSVDELHIMRRKFAKDQGQG